MEHKHIKFHEGHITWTGKEKPSEAVMEAFEALYDFILSKKNKCKDCLYPTAGTGYSQCHKCTHYLSDNFIPKDNK